MDMFSKIFQFIMLYPILPILYFILNNEVKPKKQIIMAVTLPHHTMEDPAVISVCDEYQRELRKYAILLAILPFAVFFVEYTSIVLAIVMNWMLLTIILLYISFIRHHKKLKALKQERNWVFGSERKMLNDLKDVVEKESRPNRRLFVPPIIISAVPLLYEVSVGQQQQTQISVLVICSFLLLTTGIFLIFNRLVYRQPAEIIDEDSNYNLNLTRIRRRNSGRFLLHAAWLNGLYSIIIWLSITDRASFTVFSVSTLIFTAGILWVVLKAEFSTRNMQYKLAMESNTPVYMDEDNYWINGMFYYNPQDGRTFVNTRVGIGITFNFAKPVGKLFMPFIIFSLLSIPAISAWTIAEEFTPIKVATTDTSIVIRHLSETARIDVAEIESIEVLDELPRVRKITGTNVGNIRKGTFNVDGYGRSRLYLNMQNPPFLLVKTKQGYTVINMSPDVLNLISQH